MLTGSCVGSGAVAGSFFGVAVGLGVAVGFGEAVGLGVFVGVGVSFEPYSINSASIKPVSSLYSTFSQSPDFPTTVSFAPSLSSLIIL